MNGGHLLRQETDALHPSLACCVDHIGYVFKIDAVLALHKGYLLGPLLEDASQPAVQLIPADSLMVDLQNRLLVGRLLGQLNDDRSLGLRGGIAFPRRLRNLGLQAFVCRLRRATITMNMMINTSCTSISGVTFICGPDAPPPPIDIAMIFSP